MQGVCSRGDDLPLDPPRDNCRCSRLVGPFVEQLVPPGVAVCNLCTKSVEKQIREEQVWRRQETFQDWLFRFQDWLSAAEATAASPESSQVSFAHSKKELQRFEALQRQVWEHLWPLESLSRQLRQLARSGSALGPQLRSAVQEINQRWDDLRTRTAAIYKRLKHFVSQQEEFELETETIRVWLMELDLRLTGVEHFSGGTLLEKMMQLQEFKQDVQANAERVDRLLVHGERLIQKSQPEDAEMLEEELQDLSCVCQEVFHRVFRFHWRLGSIWLVLESKWWSDQESDLESDCFTEDSLELVENHEMGLPLPPNGPRCQPTPKTALLRCKRQAPNLVGVVDLEWDPSVDVGGSTSHDEEDSSYYSAITGLGHWEEPSQRCRRSSRQVCRSLTLRCGSQEDSFVQNDFQEGWEGFLTNKEMQLCHSGKSLPRERDGDQHPQTLPRRKGSCHPTEPLGFDPQRVESWLGQAWQEKPEVQGTPAAHGCVPFPSQSQRTGRRRVKRQQKPQQQPKRKTKLTFIGQPGQICRRKQLDPHSPDVAIEKE
ncbi:nesprin-2-like isoform X2 [Hemicordylus capensis]|uniref:nesprin-2-like isoform X2 n=1 Tax=Hemicordylus capensis TaxID=884348 RepID=UPI00230260EC|nr:nesprin-2-like isoform X2 [Hemicordylus capensis]